MLRTEILEKGELLTRFSFRKHKKDFDIICDDYEDYVFTYKPLVMDGLIDAVLVDGKRMIPWDVAPGL